MLHTRRDIGKMALASAARSALAGVKPQSVFGGVQIGVISYSFRALPSSAEDVLKYCLECGIGAIELISDVAETFAGSPVTSGGSGGGRAPNTPERQAAMQKAASDRTQWRLSVSMDKYKAFRKMYAEAGVKIYAFKLPPTMSMSDQEYEYIWNVAETIGANHITMELPASDEFLQRVAEYAAKRKLRIAFHTHGHGGDSGFAKALSASNFTALNLDVGHYFGVTGESPVPVIEKYHDRIASLHLQDRRGPSIASPKGGPNMPWGQGETPLKEILQAFKKKKYWFPASIEYEYDTPAGSDVLAEVKKCVQFCQQALA